jgi:hypothetical protein
LLFTESNFYLTRPNNWRNDPSKKKKQEDELDEIMKILKERYKRTVERKWKEKEYLIFDREKGIINEDSGEIVVELSVIISSGYEIKDEENTQNFDLSDEEQQEEENMEENMEETIQNIESSEATDFKNTNIEKESTKETETELHICEKGSNSNPNEINSV